MTQLLVTPEKLDQTANEFEGIYGNANQTIQAMLDIVNALSSKWEGEASSAYQQQFRMLDTDMTKLRAMIKEHVDDLRQIANIYRKSEADNVSLSSSLPLDAIN